MTTLKRLAVAYVNMFAMIHVGALFLNVRVAGYPLWGEVSLIICAALLYASLILENGIVYTILAALWSVLAMAQWVRLAPWLPPWSDLQYTTMAVLDMVLVVAFLILAREDK